MAKRNPVSSIQNVWFDSEQVDAEDLIVEQNYNNAIDSAIVNNHIGSGIVPSALQNSILLDTDAILNSPELDGEYVSCQKQPSDNNFGNQLEIELQKSSASGRRNVKIAIIGLGFDQKLQYETFVFKTNESQVTKKHYTSVLQVLINDFRGDASKSLNLGGRIIIREAPPFYLSRDTISLAQNMEPNLFWRDFFVSNSYSSLGELLNEGLSNYNIKDLNILESSSKQPIKFSSGNVTQQVGQKFKSNTNNIQKIVLLLSATNEGSSPSNNNWTGDILLSIYPLQTTLQCPTDLPPETLLGYPPSPVPLAQISVNMQSLMNRGIVLDSVAQPVEFVFSNTAVSTQNSITPGGYYAITLKRATGSSGSADEGEIYVHTGGKYLTDSVKTALDATDVITSSNDWVDDPQSDLWFEIHSSGAKITDGQAYVAGNGIILEKAIYNELSAETVDYCLDNIYFSGSDVFTATVFASNEKTTPVQDLRTGNLVYSRQKNIPEIKLLSTIDLESVKSSSDPLLAGSIADKNIRYFDPSNSSFAYNLKTFSFFKNEIFVKISDDDSKDLRNRFLSGDLINAKIKSPSNPSVNYVISSAELVSAKYGNLTNNSYIDQSDVDALRFFVGFDFSKTPSLNSQINFYPSTMSPQQITFINGYRTYANGFVQGSINFYLTSSVDNSLILPAIQSSQLIVDSSNPKRATVEISYNTATPPGLIGNYLVINGNSNQQNNGGFSIVEIISEDDSNKKITVAIEKILLNKDTMVQLFQSNLDGYHQITENDVVELQNYVDKSAFITPSTVGAVGQEFSMLRMVIEKRLSDGVTDRSDDYVPYGNVNSRASIIHKLSDFAEENLALLDISDLEANPIIITFDKQQYWEDYLVVSESKPKYVSAAFNQSEGVPTHSQNLNGISVQLFNNKPNFDSGRVDSFVASNIILGDGAEILRGDGSPYKVDFEIATVVFEIPPGTIANEYESTIDLFNNFIKDNGSGITQIGFPAMKFADGSFVDDSALNKNQLRFSVSIQSLSEDNSKINSKLGVSIDYETGLMHILFNELLRDGSQPLISTRIQVTVFLKKAGFNNKELVVDYTKTLNISQISSIESSGDVGGNRVYKNPHYIYAFSGNKLVSVPNDENIGALTLNFEDIISGASSIRLEVILKSNDATRVYITMKHSDSNIIGDGATVKDIETSDIGKPLFIQSDNLIPFFKENEEYMTGNHIYQVFSTSSANITYQSCRLAIYY